MKPLLHLPMLLALAACDTPSAARRAQFPDDARVRADVVAQLAADYGLQVAATAPAVTLSCTVQGSQCELVARVDAADSGLPTHFLLWPRYRGSAPEFTLAGIDDDLRPRLLRAELRRWFGERLIAADAPLATLRVAEFNGFVGIEPTLGGDLAVLRAMKGDQLLAEHGADLGINLYVYVLASPEDYEPRLRAGLARLLADPQVRALGHGLDIRWFFRRERPEGERGAEQWIEDAPNQWLPASNAENTIAKWQLRIGGDDLDQSVDALWPQIDRQQPMLTQ